MAGILAIRQFYLHHGRGGCRPAPQHARALARWRRAHCPRADGGAADRSPSRSPGSPRQSPGGPDDLGSARRSRCRSRPAGGPVNALHAQPRTSARRAGHPRGHRTRPAVEPSSGAHRGMARPCRAHLLVRFHRSWRCRAPIRHRRRRRTTGRGRPGRTGLGRPARHARGAGRGMDRQLTHVVRDHRGRSGRRRLRARAPSRVPATRCHPPHGSSPRDLVHVRRTT